MSVNFNLGSTPVQTPITATPAPTEPQAKEAEETTAAAAPAAATTGAASEPAAVYEPSKEAKADGTVTKAKQDRSAIIAQLKADAEARTNQLMDIVRKTMQGQGKAIGIASTDDMWRFLADGNFTVDAATKAQAQKDIAEDGYWGVEQTSDRILDFAKALSGDDPEQADKLLDAFKKGFEDATKTWGKDLPDLTQKTFDAVVKKFDDWKNGTSENAADSASKQQEANQQQVAATVAAGES